MDKKFGKNEKGKWKNVKRKDNDMENEEEDVDFRNIPEVDVDA